MTEITAYKTEQGEIFESKEKAEQYEKEVYIKEELSKFYDQNLCFQPDYEIPNILFEYREELLKILQ